MRWRRAVGSRGCGWMGAFAGAGPWPRRPGGFDRSHWLARVRGSACGGSGLTGADADASATSPITKARACKLKPAAS